MSVFNLSSRQNFKTRVKAWGLKLDVVISSITVRALKNKWASCSRTGRFTFDIGLLELPLDLQDFVIVHELLHFHVPNHGKLWKSLMVVHLGNYEDLDRRLKAIVAKGSI